MYRTYNLTLDKLHSEERGKGHTVKLAFVEIGALFWRTRAGTVIVVAIGGAEHQCHAILRHRRAVERLVAWWQCDRVFWSYADYEVFLKNVPSRYSLSVHTIDKDISNLGYSSSHVDGGNGRTGSYTQRVKLTRAEKNAWFTPCYFG